MFCTLVSWTLRTIVYTRHTRYDLWSLASANEFVPLQHGMPSFLLIPPSGTDTSELSNIYLEGVLPKRNQVLRDAIHACGVTQTLPAIHFAPDGARLVVDTVMKKIWVDGLELRDIPSDSHLFGSLS